MDYDCCTACTIIRKQLFSIYLAKRLFIRSFTTLQLFKSMHVLHLNFSSHTDLNTIGILSLSKSHSAQKAKLITKYTQRFVMSLVKKKCSTYLLLDNQFCQGYLDPPGGKFKKEALVLQSVDNAKGKKSTLTSLIIMQQILLI